MKYSRSKLNSLKKEELIKIINNPLKSSKLKKEELINYIILNIDLRDEEINLKDINISKTLDIWSKKTISLRKKNDKNAKIEININRNGVITVKNVKTFEIVYNETITKPNFNILKKYGLPSGLRKILKEII